MGNFPVITLCGSMRYYPEMIDTAQTLTANGWIVLAPFVADYTGGKEPDDIKLMLDEMHRAKIDMSGAILVIGSHRGESTVSELLYAMDTHKHIFTELSEAIEYGKATQT